MSDGGDDDEFAIYESYLAAIRLAERRIWLTHAYFSPNKAFLQAIEQAARRGVDVRVLLPGFIDFEMILYASRSSYARLLAAGVRIYERNDALLHAKTAVVDGVWATVGSANLDIRSFAHNDEVNAVVVGVDFARQMEQQFEQDLAKAREITPETWRQRSWRSRFLEWFSRRFNYWL
jgi:cardiolipin synthase